MPRNYRSQSFWFDSLDEEIVPRSPLAASADVDVAIVGAGFSGLWTAYYLSALRPDLRIAIVEAEVAGFGASGRNGGWAVGHVSGIEGLLARPERRRAGTDLLRAVFAAIDEIGAVCRAEGVDCAFEKGGALHFATNAAQRERLQALVSELASWGLEDTCAWLTPEQVAERIRPSRCLGGTYEPNCAVLQPARLARGLARVVEARGVRIYEGTRARSIDAGRVETEGGALRAEVVVRATEGYTAKLRGYERAFLPLHSWMIATEPLPDSTWKEIGLENREAFGDARRMVTYGQRTADGRLAFGARGTYQFASGIQQRFDPQHPHFAWMERLLRGFFPVLAEARFTHHWGGAMAVPRDWRPAVGLDRSKKLAWLGGYVGQGVAAANLAGRTLADLIAGEETERTQLPWVAAPGRAWEPEPLRWLAVSSIARAGQLADEAEDAGRSSRIASRLFDAMTG